MRIVITGATGKVGFDIVNYLSHKVCFSDFYCFYRDKNSSRLEQLIHLNKNGNKVMLIHQDLSEPIEFYPDKLDLIIHSAGIRPAGLCERNFREAILSNALSTKYLVNFALLHKVKNFIFFSVQSIYNAKNELPNKEVALIEGSDLYNITKISAEMIIESAFKNKVNYQILRLAHVYGFEGLEPDGILKTYRDSAFKEFIPINHDGQQKCCFLHIKDLCDLIDKIISSPPPSGIYNVCSEIIKVAQIAEYFKRDYLKYYNKDLYLTHQEKGEKRDYGLDISKISDTMGWTPRFKVEGYIDEIIRSV